MQASGKSLAFLSAISVSAWIGILGLSAAAMYFAYAWSEQKGYSYLDDVSLHKLDLYATGLESELGKHEYLPGTLELDADVLALLTAPADPRLRETVNRRLASLNARAGSVAIFVLDAGGIARASSNWYQPKNFIGMDFSSLPYFMEAMQGGQARFFSPSIRNESPEYYFAQPIIRSGRVIGVAVVKISLAPIESTWIASTAYSHSELFLIIDENDTILMASEPDWKYKKTSLLPSMLQAKLAADQPRGEAIAPFGMVLERTLRHGSHLVSMPPLNAAAQATQYVTKDRHMVRTGWRLITLSDASDVLLNARYSAIGAGALTAFFGAFGMYWVQRRRAISSQLAARKALQQAHDELEMRIAERTAELNETNQELVREIAERKRTEQVLRDAQNELVQASKLALLGQMSAGITHEINQPLTALRALSHNTLLLVKRGNTERIEKNLNAIADLTQRMARITEQLKSFARKSPLTIGPVPLARAIENVLLLLENRIRTERIQLQVDIAEPLRAHCDGNRLEQVLINLCANAIDAMQGASIKTLSIRVWAADDAVMVRVADSGAGIPETAMGRLFEPFFSTKPAGKGLGLGLAISAGIVREFGGAMRALNLPDGAAFEFDLKLSEETSNV